MIIHDRSFPHPVLAPFRDDVMPNQFTFSATVTPDADNYYIDVRFEYINTTLAALVDDGRAAHCVHIECRRNYYRHVFMFKKTTERITIRANELVGKVEVSGFVKANSNLDDYFITGAHADYGDSRFSIRPGDVLAVAPSCFFRAFNDYDPLKKIASILTVHRSEEVGEGPMKLDTTGMDRIVAILSQKDYDRYTDLKADPNLGPLLANQVVIPALIEAVHEIRNTSDEDLDVEMSKRWFRSLAKKIQDSGIDIRKTAPMEAVQSILKLPLRRSLEGILQMNPLEENLN